MKTPMQELIDLLELDDKLKEVLPYLIDVIKDVYIKKEKEHIIDVYADGIDHDYTDLDIEFGIQDSDRRNHAEEYYNNTYKTK